MGEETGLLEHRRARRDQVVDGRPVAPSSEPVRGRGVASLGVLPEREQRLVTPELSAATRDCEHLVELEERRLEARRWLGEGAVPAAVAAEHCERDEDLGREGDAVAVTCVTHACRLAHEIGQRDVDELVSLRPTQHVAEPTFLVALARPAGYLPAVLRNARCSAQFTGPIGGWQAFLLHAKFGLTGLSPGTDRCAPASALCVGSHPFAASSTSQTIRSARTRAAGTSSPA